MDPLDGTVNYVHGIKASTVSIGLMRGNEPIGGAVYDFWEQNLYWAAEGKGAWRNQERLHPKPYENRGTQLACILEEQWKGKEGFMQVREFGCFTNHIIKLVEGHVGGCIDPCYIWDWAGIMALVRELGYRYEIIPHEDGHPLRSWIKCYREMAQKA